MKRAIQYIILLSLLLSNNLPAHAVAFPHDAVGKSAFQKETVIADALSDSNSGYHKDVLLDIDDYDDCDCEDNYTSSVKEKSLPLATAYLKDEPISEHFVAKQFCNTHYTFVNFSRLPRHSYISLRVLRI
ncbi:hypothetical protein [Flavobacterium wongokense]|uniref:hypothetical protein n=1 Tax=Flavobacterium wongokense TaxID=2910674 RepID=UPI001F229A5C|nr:hypothetical protein [Flavobacterium sp. WG47]MCF6131681.1 hypothetical protein [Flavobacterium sp. WG47]